MKTPNSIGNVNSNPKIETDKNDESILMRERPYLFKKKVVDGKKESTTTKISSKRSV